MKDNKKMELARWATKYAVENGAKEASVSIYNYTGSEVEVREQKIEKIQESIESGLSIKLYVNGRYSNHSTNRLNKTELERFIKEAIAGTQYLAEDKYRSLPEKTICYDGVEKDLKMTDSRFEEIDPRQKIELAQKIEEETIGLSDKIISVTGSFNDSYVNSFLVLSNGVEGFKESTRFSASASVSVNGGDARPSDYSFTSSRFWDQMVAEGIGREAVDRALQKIGQKKIKSGKYPMLVENRVVGRILGGLLQPLYGSNLQQKRSCFDGMIGKKIASDQLTLTDNPFIVSGMGSRLYDSEGLATRIMPIIEKGVLRNYYIDTYYGKKMEMAPTTGETSNLLFQPGDMNLEELPRSMGKGILVTGFNGGNSNSATGDFSVGVEGFWVENGEIVHPVSGMNISGNLKESWNKLVAVGNDPLDKRSWQTPSMLFEGIDFSGL